MSVKKVQFKTELQFEYVKEAINGNKHYIVTDERSYCMRQYEKYGNAVNRGRLLEMALRLYAGEDISEYEQDKAEVTWDSKKFGNIKSQNASMFYEVDGEEVTLQKWEEQLARYMERYAKRFTFATIASDNQTVTAWTFDNPEEATGWIVEYMGRFTHDSRNSTHEGQAKIGLKPETKKAIKALNELAQEEEA